MLRCEKIFEIMNLYIKQLSSQTLNFEEEQSFLAYSRNSLFANAQKISLIEEELLTENDYSMGDLVIQFKNPELVEQRPVSYKEAMNFYNEAIGSRFSIEIWQELLDDTIFSLAFQYVFTTLQDQDPDPDSNSEKLDTSYPGYISTDKLETLMAQLFYRKKKEKKNSDTRQSNIQIQESEIRQSNIQIQDSRLVPDLRKVESFLISTKNKVLESIQNKQKQIGKKEQMPKKRKQLNSVFKLKLYSQGKQLRKFEEKGQEIWKKMKSGCNDFLTLARNVILLRLSQKGFKIRTFLSQKGEYIFAVIYSSESNLGFVAESQKFRKFLNIEFTDILSFEPVDVNFRPYRLNNRLWRQLNEFKTTKYFRYIQPKILELLHDINFKKISKELNIQNLNDSMFSNGKDDLLDDDEGPSDQEWAAYYEYLIYLNRKVQEARKDFYFKIDFSVLMNPKRIKGKFIEKNNLPLLLTTLQERYQKQRQQHFDENDNRLIRTETSQMPLNRILHEILRQILKELDISYSEKEMDINKIIIQARAMNQFKQQKKAMAQSLKNNSQIDFMAKVAHFLKKYIETSREELELEILFFINSELLRKIALYLDENKNKWIPLDDLDEDEIVYTFVVKSLPELIFEEQETQERNFSKVTSMSKELDTDYVDQIQKNIIQKMYMLLVEQEIQVWQKQIQEEKVQFANLKETMHLKGNLLCTKFLKEKYRTQLGQNYGMAFREALTIVNYGHKNILKNIWDYDDFKLIHPSYEYSLPTKSMSFKKKCKIHSIWRKYQISENGRISAFSIMERLKLVNQITCQSINVPFLIKNKFILQLYCLNDLYELYGKSNKEYFQTFADSIQKRFSIIEKPLISRQKKETSNIESSDNPYNRNLIAQSLFVEPKLYNLQDLWSLQLTRPWFVPSMDVRNYYGEKIALYFIFLGQYTKQLLLRGILGLICTLIQSLAPQSVAVAFSLLYGIYHSTFLCLVIGKWKTIEKKAQIQFGQNIKEGKAVEEQRPSFVGNYRRDPMNDELNTLYSPMMNLIMKMLVNCMLLVLVFSVYLGCVIGLFYMTKFFDDYNIFDSLSAISFLKLEVSIPCIINVGILNIFDSFYENLAEKLTDNENHETVNDFEANFIIKKFSLLLLSYFAPVFMITFLNKELGIDCAYNDCYLNGSYYFSSIFILLFIFNIKEILTPIIHQWLAKKPKEEHKEDKYLILNKFIEEESQKDSYMKSVDRYGTVDDYMEIINQAGLLALFGALFPASMFVGFIWNILELQTDKNKLLLYSQRPIPLDQSSIGIWNVLLEFLSNFAVIYNSGLMYLMAKTYPAIKNEFSDITIFLGILVTAFVLRYIIETLTPEVSFELLQLIERQKYLLKCTIESFKKKVNKQLKQKNEQQLERYVIFKPYGCVLNNQKKKIVIQADDDSDALSSISDENQHQATQYNKQQLLFSGDKKQKVKKRIKNQYFEFAKKRFESGKQQRIYNQKISLMKLYLKSFEKCYLQKWCEQRFLYRRFYIRRSQKIIIYLNIRKLRIYWDSYKTLYDRFMNREQIKHQKLFIEEQEILNRKSMLKSKQKAKQQCRKVVILKTRGVWFGQFRRQNRKLRSKQLIEQLRVKYFDTMKQKNRKKFVSISNIVVSDELLIKERWKIFEQITGLEISKTSPQEIIKLMVRDKSIYSNFYQTEVIEQKNSLVRNLEQLYSLNTKKLELMQTETYHYEFPSYLEESQEQLRNLFIAINQKQSLRQFDFTLMKPISGFQTLKYPHLSNLFHNPLKSLKQVWLIQSNFRLKILEMVEIRIGFEQSISDINQEQLLLHEFNLFDHFFFPYSKGVIARIIEPKNQLMYGWTLKDTIQNRKLIGLYYDESELLSFLNSMIQNIQLSSSNQILTPSSILAFFLNGRVGYTFIWESFGNRVISVNNYEFLCCSSEQLQFKGTTLANIVYNIGIIMVYMMNLGESFETISEKLESLKIDQKEQIQLIVVDYLNEKQSYFMEKYPIMFTIVQDMLLSEKQRKSYQYFKTLCENECKGIQVFFEKYNLSAQLEQQARKDYQIDLPFDDFKLYDQNQMVNQYYAQLVHKALSCELYKLDLFYKLKLLEQFKFVFDQCQQLLQQIFQEEDYQKHLLENLDFYCDKPQHQKVLLDVLEIKFYEQLHRFVEQIDLDHMNQSKFIPYYPETSYFINKIMTYTSLKAVDQCSDQNQVLMTKKRLRMNRQTYDQLQEKIETITQQLQFLSGFAEMCDQKYNRSLAEFNQIPMQQLKLEKQIILKLCITMQSPNEIVKYDAIINAEINQIQNEQIRQYYKTKCNILKIRVLTKLQKYEEAVQLCHIENASEHQCIFDQSIYQQIQILMSEICWCQDKYQGSFDFILLWLKIYRKTFCIDMLIHVVVYIEKCINLLYYNENIHLTEEILQCLYKLQRENFLVIYLEQKLLHILNLQSGIMKQGIVCLFDEDSGKAYKRILQKLCDSLPKGENSKQNYLNQIKFEIMIQNNAEFNHEIYIKDVEKNELQRRLFIIAKLYFFNQKHQQCKQLLDQLKLQQPQLLNGWKLKCAKYLDQPYNFTIQFGDASWKYFMLSLVFDSTNPNAQLISRMGLKMVWDLQIQTDETQQLQQQLKIIFIKLLLQEYNNPNNIYIQKSFQIKFYILSTINNSLQELCLYLLESIYEIEDEIKQKELKDYTDPAILTDKQNILLKTKFLNDLIVVQSLLLEESGDPVAALKCLDVQYALMLYDQKFEKQVILVFSRKLSVEDPNFATSKCKIAMLKLFLNLFDQSINLLIKVKKLCLDFCQQIVETTIANNKITQNKAPSNKIIWDPFVTEVLRSAKPQQIEAFQKYKLIYYQTELTLLEVYIQYGQYKDAIYQYQIITNHYVLLEDKYLKSLFEYSLAQYEKFNYQLDRAFKLYNRALVNIDDELADISLAQYDELQLKFQLIDAPFRDEFSDLNIEKELLEHLNHKFTFKSRCQIGICYTQLFNHDQKDQYALFPKIILVLESIRKTMGRQSILYADALIIYAEYLLFHLENERFQDLKITFKTQYFYSRKLVDYFRPGVYVNTLPESYSYIFYSLEEIETRFSLTLIGVWVQDLLTQINQFYTKYYSQVNILDHFSIIYCNILLQRISFNKGKIYTSQDYITKALQSLERICPSMDHPLAIIIYERQALIQENIVKLIEENIKIILECPQTSLFNILTKRERVTIVKGILQNDETLNKYFDDYKQSGFEYYLFQKLETYVDRPKTDLKKMKKKLFSLDFTEITLIKEEAKRLIMFDESQKKTEIESITYFRRAYRICKQIFKEQNILFTRIEQKFIELSRQEQRDLMK